MVCLHQYSVIPSEDTRDSCLERNVDVTALIGSHREISVCKELLRSTTETKYKRLLVTLSAKKQLRKNQLVEN